MKKFFLFLYFPFYIFNSAFSQNPLVKQWDYRFGGIGWDNLHTFQQTTDGGNILGGFSNSDSSGDKTQNTKGEKDYWIVKTDSLGNKQWDKDFGGTDWDELYSLHQTSDGGYILGGFSYSDSSGDKSQDRWGGYDYWIVKTDSLGNKQWDKTYGGILHDQLFSLQQTSDGGYILGGISISGINGDKTQNTWGNFDYWIVKIDSLGKKQWDKDFGGTDNDWLWTLQQTNDKGYILGGYSISDSSGDKTKNTWGSSYDYWLVKTDSLGNKLWDKDLGGTDLDYLFSLQQTAEGGYILGGISRSGFSGDKTQAVWGVSGDIDYWIVKTDSLGNKQWDKDFGGTDIEDRFGNISQLNDGGYLFAGNSFSDISGNKTENNLGPQQTWVVTTDSSGNKVWDKTIFTSGDDYSGFAIQKTDGCYTIANFTDSGIGGYKTQASWGLYDYWIIKFCDSTLTTGVTNFQPPPDGYRDSGFQIIPNPANESFQVSGFWFPVNKIEIFNLLGETIFSAEPETLNFKLHTLNFPSGIYIIKAYTEKGVFQQKLVINH